jgi:hypothetical protein
MADDQYRTQATGGADWLNKWGLYTKLSALMDRKRHEWVRLLLAPVVQTLKMEPEVSCSLLGPVIAKVLFVFVFSIPLPLLIITIYQKLFSQDRSSVEGVRKTMLATVAEGGAGHEQCVYMWATVLSHKAIIENWANLLETLLSGYYFERAGAIAPILPSLGAIEASKKNISRYSGKCIYSMVSFLFFPHRPPTLTGGNSKIKGVRIMTDSRSYLLFILMELLDIYWERSLSFFFFFFFLA